MNSSIQLKSTFAVALSLCRRVFVLCCFVFCSTLQAVTPAPDGGYVNGNTAEGTNALFSLTTGTKNTTDGYLALFFNTNGRYNTAAGAQALYHNTTGGDNTAAGFEALYSNTTGYYNAANGYQALYHNTVGGENTANGGYALYNNSVGSYNTATGYQALYFNFGDRNTANGYQALYRNADGTDNTADGDYALYNNSSGYANTANGEGALYNNTAGTSNTANGEETLYSNTTGSLNTAVGLEALLNNSSGGGNIALGVFAGGNLTTGNFNIDIGNDGVAAESGTIRIGDSHETATFIAGISGADATGGDPVFITSDGKLGTVNPPSSARFKDDIKPMDKASDAILALRPVTFHYKKEFDPSGVQQFGLLAEEVEKVNPALVKRGRDNKLQTVRYDAVNAMLLNEFLKEHAKVKDLETTIVQLKSVAAKREAIAARQQKDFEATTARQEEEINALSASLKDQAKQIQNVSVRLELSKPAPLTTANGQ
jgi:trimeric autotransporter adhesin